MAQRVQTLVRQPDDGAVVNALASAARAGLGILCCSRLHIRNWREISVFDAVLRKAEVNVLSNLSSKGKRFVLGGIVLIAGAAAVVLWSQAAKARSQDPAGSVEVATVTRRDIGYTVKATGIVKPRVGAEVRVGSRTSGVVRRLLVRIGDQVEKGELLAEVDDRELDSQREVARAQVASARAALQFADADLERRRELAASALISRSDLEVAERAFAMAAAQAHQSEASLAAAATQLGYSRIVAPIRGVVSSVATQEGETVAASFAAPTFLTLLDLTRLEVWAYVDETDIGRIKVGQAAHFTVDTYPTTNSRAG